MFKTFFKKRLKKISKNDYWKKWEFSELFDDLNYAEKILLEIEKSNKDNKELTKFRADFIEHLYEIKGDNVVDFSQIVEWFKPTKEWETFTGETNKLLGESIFRRADNWKRNSCSDIETTKTNQLTLDKFNYSSASSLREILEFIKDNSKQLGIHLTVGATEKEIREFEEIETKLPEDFKEIYKFSNGFETDEDLFRLIPLSEIKNRGKDGYLISKNSFHFTEYLIYCDMWTVDVSIENPNKYKIYNKTNNVVFLTESLCEFLAKFLNKGIYEGLYKWREEIEKTKN